MEATAVQMGTPGVKGRGRADCLE
ncbi:unnamed protein product [Staurois parvus]|uniref:Uncharacterized protein n=1 Tax=Staurois parvus TaxID=386267 RepID=A0ABN9EG51_9NEOB|nr:unnamed protein product [Staurois parvus]